MKGIKFVASYSGGKDSVLALYRAIKSGMDPVALIITYNTDKERSWFHGVPKEVLDSVSQSLALPIWLIKTSGEKYAENFEKTLTKAKDIGAKVCVFGDIDIEEHNEWCSKRCENVGLEPYFPLWNESRKSLVYEFIDSGFTATLTVIDNSRVDEEFLGNTLSRRTAERLEQSGIDVCGENGEYHTFVSAGPLFKKEIQFKFGEKIVDHNYSVMPILAK